MAVRRGLCARLLMLLAGGVIGSAVWAQDLGVTVSAILTIDSERVFNTTIAGRRIAADLEDRLNALAQENRRIEAELVAEELDLTERRVTMDTDEFRALADAFDEKVQRIRAEQDAKQRVLERIGDTGRQSFIEAIGPILSRIGRERGAVVILERRDVLLSSDNIDITDEAITRINEALGAGGQPGDDLSGDVQPEDSLGPEPDSEQPLDPEATPASE